ncbi:MAG TPA: hypothetical protein ENH29_01515 [Bacteroidetes bacterium]|nr:hypothetical protein [Bacteroidota bacterium]
MESVSKNRRSKWDGKLKWFITISILLHLFFLLGYGYVSHYQFLQAVPKQPKEDDKRIVFEIIESPEKAKNERPKNAKLFSDKNTRAKNPQTTDKTKDTPFSAGDIKIPALPKPRTQPEPARFKPDESQKQRTKKQEEPTTSTDEMSYINPPERSFSRDLLLGKKPAARSEKPQPQYNNREFSVDDMGGFAFNTYNWNWAPYLLYLKKRIQRHIFPPPAFTQMGIIDGRTVLRFFIAKNGKLLDLKILNYIGHASLMETSVNAINGSAPFRSLPADFPEDALEVTGTFVYKTYH